MAKFVLMRRDTKSKLFADWSIIERGDVFERLVHSRERRRKRDRQANDERWEYQIETVATATLPQVSSAQCRATRGCHVRRRKL